VSDEIRQIHPQDPAVQEEWQDAGDGPVPLREPRADHLLGPGRDDLAERDRAEVGQQFASADLSHGLFAVLEGMARHHFAVKPNEQVLLCTEVMSEARRNPEIARISRSFDADVKKWRIDLLQAAAERGDIPADVDLEGVVTMLMIIADGVWWRRALDPGFDPESVVPIFMDITRHMLRSRPQSVPKEKVR